MAQALLKAAAFLLLLLFSTSSATCARILDEDEPLVDPLAAPPETSDPDTNPIATTIAPMPAVQPPVSGASATSVNGANVADPHHPLTFFMHDILGGSHPSARMVTGIVSNAGVNGQLPFAKPTNGGGSLPNGNINNNNNNNNMPFLTGLGGQTTTPIINNNGNNIIGGNGIPYLTTGQLPAGATLQKLMFGTMTVIDDELTEGHELGSGVVGKAQGFYVASSEDGSSQTLAFTAMFESGRYMDSLVFFGVHRTLSGDSQVAVVGGTGKYNSAKGYASVKTLHAGEQQTTDGVESLLELIVYLSY